LLIAHELFVPPAIFCEGWKRNHIWPLEMLTASIEKLITHACVCQYLFQGLPGIVLLS